MIGRMSASVKRRKMRTTLAGTVEGWRPPQSVAKVFGGREFLRGPRDRTH